MLTLIASVVVLHVIKSFQQDVVGLVEKSVITRVQSLTPIPEKQLQLNLSRLLRTQAPDTTATFAPEVSEKAANLNISANAFVGLQQSLGGVRLEKRKTSLEGIGKMVKIKKKPKKVKKLKKKIKKVKVEENLPAKDLFEVNQAAGLSPFLFQGDMNMNEDQLTHVKSTLNSTAGERKKRQLSNSAPLWPNNTVYFYFDSSVSSAVQKAVHTAHAYIAEQTCISFVEDANATNRVKVFDGSGCYSSVGMIGGEQTLSLGDGCQYMGTAAHEFTHTLGFFHTQMRSDRDTYVTIDLTDVPTGSQLNFMEYSASLSTNLVPYEYGSVMHYAANSFVTTNGSPSIIALNTNFVYTMGCRIISFYDIYMLNLHYSCLCTDSTSATCSNGGYPNPTNCSTCNCPLGYGGNLCNELPSVGCGEELTATEKWQNVTINFGDSTNWSSARNYYDFCIYWITAPEGKIIELKVIAVYNTQCSYGCNFNGVELKIEADQKSTNPRYCCPEFNNVTLKSSVNPTPVIAYNRYYISTFAVAYRYVDSDLTTTTTSTTTSTTTATTTMNANCYDLTDSTTCSSLYANSASCPYMSKARQKLLCAKTFGLCGKVASSPCADLYSGCAQYEAAGFCTSMTPLVAEHNCASTCGFCSNPV